MWQLTTVCVPGPGDVTPLASEGTEHSLSSPPPLKSNNNSVFKAAQLLGTHTYNPSVSDPKA